MDKHDDVSRCPLDILRPFQYAEKAQKAMARAQSALAQDDLPAAEEELGQAFRQCQIGTFGRSALADMIGDWRSAGWKLRKTGNRSLGSECLEIAKYLSARLQNGEFWDR